ncbi:M56 family metallopeptidase [Stieleria neptunia]|nr:M56 family metallopeptidase [Stieleria neptunia]
MIVMALCPVFTWWTVSYAANFPSDDSSIARGINLWMGALLPSLPIMWIIGVLLFSARPIAGYWGQLRMMRKPCLDAPELLTTSFRRTALRFGIRETVQLRVVSENIGPMALGWFRPVIVVPISLVTSMPPHEIDALLAHELAHVKRHDCWFNAFQVLIETAFFYHPAVWWVSRQVRVTREHCCDDMAAPDRQAKLMLGRALMTLEQNRGLQFSLSLAANEGDLLRRIRRLSSRKALDPTRPLLSLASCMVLVSTMALITMILVPNEHLAQREDTFSPQMAQSTSGETHSDQSEVAHHETQTSQAPKKELERVHEVDSTAAIEPAPTGEQTQFESWDLTLSECVAIAVSHSAKTTTSSEDSAISSVQESAEVIADAPPSQSGEAVQRAERVGSAAALLAEYERISRHASTNTERIAAVHPTVQGQQLPGLGPSQVNRRPIIVAPLENDESLDHFEIKIHNLVRDVEVAYWDLHVAYRVARAQSIARDDIQKTAEFTKLNLDAGTGTIQELSQAVGQYWNAQRRLTSSLNGSTLPGDDRLGVYGRESKLRALLGLASVDGRLIHPTDEPSDAQVQFDLNESVNMMLKASPERRDQNARNELQKAALAWAKKRISQEVNTAVEERLVLSQLSEALANSTKQHQLVQTYEQQAQASETEVAVRFTEFQAGRSPVNTVLQSLERRTDSQVAYFRAKAEYRKATNYVAYLSGTLLANNNIQLNARLE